MSPVVVWYFCGLRDPCLLYFRLLTEIPKFSIHPSDAAIKSQNRTAGKLETKMMRLRLRNGRKHINKKTKKPTCSQIVISALNFNRWIISRLPKFILTARVSVSFVLTPRLAMRVNKEDSWLSLIPMHQHSKHQYFMAWDWDTTIGYICASEAVYWIFYIRALKVLVSLSSSLLTWSKLLP